MIDFYPESVYIYVMKHIDFLTYEDEHPELSMDPVKAWFDDARADGLHNREAYELIKRNCSMLHIYSVSAILESLDEHDLGLIEQCTNWFAVHFQKQMLLEGRDKRAKYKVQVRLNAPIEEMLDDYVSRRKGKVTEARRQLRKRFDGLDHDIQEKIMMAFMASDLESDRKFIAAKLYGDDFWVDNYIPLVERWWEELHDGFMAKVVVKRCSREYILKHIEDLEGKCNYATLCLKTGMQPKEGTMPARTLLYVLKTVGGQLEFRQGERVVLGYIREMLYENGEKEHYEGIYDIPYVKRMILYLGEMNLLEDILTLDAFDHRMREMPDWQRTNLAIKAIEEEFDFPEYVFKEIQ